MSHRRLLPPLTLAALATALLASPVSAGPPPSQSGVSDAKLSLASTK